MKSDVLANNCARKNPSGTITCKLIHISGYDSLYPDDEYRIEHPFDFTSYEPCELNIGEQEMYENHVNKFKPKIMDQHLRYPPDYNTGGFSYKIDSDYFNILKEKLMAIYSKINC